MPKSGAQDSQASLDIGDPMAKDLSQMTLEELWQLFPIFLVAPSSKWEDYYLQIENQIKNLLKPYSIDRISHIGSTAIKGIWAKDIVDVLIEIPKSQDISQVASKLEKNGFIIMSTARNRISLNKGYTNEGFAQKVYHIHIRFTGDNDELYFRDYLNSHSDIAKQYEALKLDLWKKYEHNRDAYTDAKSEFITKWTKEARREYEGKY